MKTNIGFALDRSANGREISQSPYKVVVDVMHLHRYLQANIFGFVCKLIKTYAYRHKNYKNLWFDGRNEWVGAVCEKICDEIDELRIFDYDIEQINSAEYEFPLEKDKDCFE